MPQTIPFTKGHGTGNDFVIVADPDGALDLSDDQIAVLCDRRFGIGGDGVLRVVRCTAIDEGAAAAAAGAEWFMDYRNADGSKAEMCGNGIRVYLHYLLEAGLTQLEEGGSVLIGTRNGPLPLSRSALGYEVDLGRFRIEGGEMLVRTRGNCRYPGPASGSTSATRMSWSHSRRQTNSRRSISVRAPSCIPSRPRAPTSSSSFRRIPSSTKAWVRSGCASSSAA